MYFQSPTFLFAFLPIVLVFLGVAGVLVRRPAWRVSALNVILLVCSLVFYAWGEQFLVLLLVASWLGNYVLARFTERWPRGGVWVALLLNLGVLVWFKYLAFGWNSLAALNPSWGLHPLAARHMPLGLSFFTFQAISYIVDVSRRTVPAERSMLRFGVYVFLFPHLIAGPIVRYADLALQLKQRAWQLEQFATGIQRFIIGLAKKVVLANSLAVVADDTFGMSTQHLGFTAAWLGLMCYSLQIYFDFSGYSDMAIGLGKMVGFDFHENFRYPYCAFSVTDFWRRWHISLSSWFRDYVYIPLGGNRAGAVRTLLNLVIVFVLCGLWHGANWTFLVWGLLHGALLVVERFGFGVVLSKLWAPLRYGYVLVAVAVAWVVFRAEDLGHAGGYLQALLGLAPQPEIMALDLWRNRLWLVLPVACIAAMPVLPWLQQQGEEWLQRNPWRALAWGQLGAMCTVMLLALVAMQLVVGRHSPFIYFRF